MKLPRWKNSLKWRIVVSYSLILIAGGVSTSLIGIRVTGGALLEQAQHEVNAGLSHARSIFQNRLTGLRQCVELLATSRRVRGAFMGDAPGTARDFMRNMQEARHLDFLSIADVSGRVRFRTMESEAIGDSVADLGPIAQALTGRIAASAELLPRAQLERERPALVARLGSDSPELSGTRATGRLEGGLVLLAAAPVTDAAGGVIAVLYAGELLNEADPQRASREPHAIVDQVRNELFPGLQYEGRPVGAASIFQNDVRIATTVMTADGRRALGTRVSQKVYQKVMVAGEPWSDRAFVLTDWYIAAYEPIVNLAGERIGMLSVGLLERPYTTVRDRVTQAFAAIALLCFALIVVVTYFLTRSLMRPLEDVVAASKAISAGDLSHRLGITDQSELGVVASSFNAMLDRIAEMNSQLEESAKRLEQKVRERTAQLVEAQAAMSRQERLASLGRLAAGVAHEINNPLTGVLSFAHLLRRKENMEESDRQDLDLIINETTRVGEIVRGLLDFAKERPSTAEPLDINEVTRHTTRLVSSQGRFDRIKFEEHLQADLPGLNGDRSQLEQVILNLLLNACEAMPDRGTVTISTAAEEGKIMVTVADTGCGIEPASLDRIFEPFFTTKSDGKSTGLGLSVSYGIVQQHGGTLDVDSEEGRGTVFTLVLPAFPSVPSLTSDQEATS